MGITVGAVLVVAAGAPSRTVTAMPPLRPFVDASLRCTKIASPRGRDSAKGTFKAPYRTPQRLLRSLRPGQVGCLRAGTYTASGEFVLDAYRPGAVIRSYPGERATLEGIIQIRHSADHTKLAGLSIVGTGGRNTIKVYADDFVLEDNDVTNLWRGRSCLLLGSSRAGSAYRPLIRRNRFHECGDLRNGNLDHAIYAALTADGLITENLFTRTAAYAIQFYPDADRMVFSHNTVDGGAPSVRGGVVFASDGEHASSDNRVEHNVIAYARTYNVTTSWSRGVAGDGNVVEQNCVWAGERGDIYVDNGVTARENLVADPAFAARSSGSARLSPASPCLAVVEYDPARLIE